LISFHEEDQLRERPPVLAHERFRQRAHEFVGLGREAIFTEIWRSNLWGADTSRSGLGSEDRATQPLREEFPILLEKLGVRTLLDIPCGDFGWMSRTPLKLEWYLGADIVQELVVANQTSFGGMDGRVRFQKLDLISDALPCADAVLCRDCLVHFSYSNIAAAFANLRSSGSRLFLATTFPDHTENHDATDGDWRLINLEKPPFCLPRPIALLNEGCREAGGGYSDKSLGVWRIEDLAVP
jgi:hypothetical protein